MNHTFLGFLILGASAFLLASCASENVQKRVDRRDGTLNKMGENMEIRQQARSDRYDRRFDRMMN